MAAVNNESVAQIRLKPRKAQPLFSRHPWVRSAAIATVGGSPADGDVVDLVSDSGEWIARGIYNSQSRIRVRLYSWNHDQPLDESFWRARLENALTLRRTLGYDDPAGAARMVYSEADGLSGLIVDRYGGHLVLQPTALAMAARLEVLVQLLAEMTQPTSVAVRLDDTTARLEGISLSDGVVWGERREEHVDIVEHGVRYRVPLADGQKTGFYLDQRENRRAAARYMRGRTVLDVCTYSGGFALAAAVVGRAARVVGIDGSEPAIELARQNATANDINNAEFHVADCFDDLTRRVPADERFGAVVLDPPKFATGRRQIEAALRAYHRLNISAVQLLEPGGILVTCCCSGSVDRQDFLEMLFGVALKSGREIQILEQHGAAPDHPVSLTCPENAYLKCFICRVV